MAAEKRRGQFEYFIASRYLRAKRKQVVISIVTVISVIGVAAGVMALVIALAINNGFRTTLQRSLLGATAHVTVLEKQPGEGIGNYTALAKKLRGLPHVVSASPTLYGQEFVSSPLQSEGAVLKGILPGSGSETAGLLRNLKQGRLEALEDQSGLPGIILGSKLAERTGLPLNSVATVISPQGELTPFGLKPSYFRFRVVGIFETGFFEIDYGWAFTSLKTAQQVFALQDVVNAVELKLDDVNLASEVARSAEQTFGSKLAATSWMEQNRQIFNALKMEKAVTIVTIGLIVLVAALNILIALVMMVMEKYRDVAILASMGARREQIRRIFVYQGLLIGTVGTIIGLAAGYTISFLADRFHWIRLDEEVYALSYVPFDPRWIDGIWIAAVAIVISYLATLYPSRNATQITPVEALRYE